MRRRRASARTAIALGASVIFMVTATASALTVNGPSQPAFSKTVTATRINVDNGVDVPVDSRTVTVNADRTDNLRDSEIVNVSWSGAHPTGGIIFDQNGQNAQNQEYPVAILQCRGVDANTIPTAQRIRPETCFTQTPLLRYQFPSSGEFPPYRVDRYAAAADRARVVGRPADAPASCPGPYDGQAERWVHFIGYDGHDYAGGSQGCAGLAPEQSVAANPLAPPNTTFAATDGSGKGSAKFIVQTAESNATLGCDREHACAIVVIPIMGISCDAAGTQLPVGDSTDRPADADVPAVAKACERTGRIATGVPGDQLDANGQGDPAVTGRFWWSESNWRNRVTIPITFGVSASVCSVFQGGASEDIYGSQYIAAATQQWQPKFCLDKTLTPFQHVQVSEVQAKNLLSISSADGYSGVKAAFQGAPPQPPFVDPIVQAPTAVTGFSIAYVMDAYHGLKSHEYLNLKLTPRLLAKALAESYPAYTGLRDAWKQKDGYEALANNPVSMVTDPEFRALNPDMAATSDDIPAATLFAMSSDSDVMTALTSYINADPDARAWLNGTPDPWGMVVNPKYKGIVLPVSSWPLLDDTVFDDLTQCQAYAPTPNLPLVAGPVSDPAQITQNLLYGIANSQTACPDPSQNLPDLYKRTAVGREYAPNRFILGVVSLGDASRYQLNSAQLLTQKNATAEDKFTDLAGRSFVGPTEDSLRNAAKLMTPDDSLGTWTLPYDRLQTDPAGVGAYPGTMLISTDVPTKGLAAVDAAAFARFLRFVAGPGQSAGQTPGTLPGGYLPITAANGLAPMAAYTTMAADAVAAQKGLVPFVSGKEPPGNPTQSPAATPVVNDVSHTVPVAAPSSGSEAPPAGEGPGTTPSGSSSGARQVTSGSAPPLTSVSKTISTRSLPTGPLALVLPVLVGVAIAAGAASAWLSGVGRR